MFTYEIWIRSTKYHSRLPLTYTSTNKLLPGTVVKVSLRNQFVIGFVRREAPAPKGVAMKPINDILLNGEFRLPPESLKLINWLLSYYPSGSGAITQLFLPSSWPKVTDTSTPFTTTTKLSKPLQPLTKEQAKVLQSIRERPGSFLLHGDTGTGKTRVYLELAKKILAKNQSCIILVPEIGLVPHMTTYLELYISNVVIESYHSGLTPSQRRKVWSRILTSKQPMIVVGPRSALFAPLANIGLVIVDECHDDGYKQESSPRYNGLRVASKLAQLHNSTLVLGSATPSISDMYIAKEKKIPILRMTKLATNEKKSNLQVQIINKKDKTKFSQSDTLSDALIHEISRQLQLGNQSLLFLNRRGSARMVACVQCGWRSLCPSCELPLTFHADKFSMHCHTCGRSFTVPKNCPDCSNTDIIYSGPGTKKIEIEVQKKFPNAKIARFDGDNSTQERLDKKLIDIQKKNLNIIIGTQVLIKGFDIPNLGLVGIIDADSSLSFPDFATEEKTYQILTQAIGRVGRGHTDGTVIIQTIQPDSQLLNQSITKNWQDFFNNQLNIREKHKFPPFVFLLKLEYSRKKYNSVVVATTKLKATIQKKYPSIKLLGPSPAFKEKQGGMYTWQLIVKSSRRSVLLKIIEELPSGWSYDIDPTHLL